MKDAIQEAERVQETNNDRLGRLADALESRQGNNPFPDFVALGIGP